MKMAIKRNTPIFSLADQLFNKESVSKLSSALGSVYPAFKRQSFERRVLKQFPDLELKDRIHCLVDALGPQLPDNFEEAVAVLTEALPAPLDPAKTDDDFGEFIWGVPAEYVARHGCEEQHLGLSLTFLRESTMRFTSEGPIRPFLAAFPGETMTFVHQCSADNNYHVRRLASEGIRPYLPWAKRVVLPPETVIEVLDKLHADSTRYVTRSVANTLNDLSRDHPELVLQTVANWQSAARQHPDELNWMTRHSLRTLVKRDNTAALEHLGYPAKPAFSISKVSCDDTVKVGDQLTWRGNLKSGASQKLKVNLRIHYRKADGSLSPRVFAVTDVNVEKGDVLSIEKSVSFKPISTRTLYLGDHAVELVVNGVARGKKSFTVIE